MDIEAFYPSVLKDYRYWGTPYVRPYEDQVYMDVVLALGEESVMTTPSVMHLLNRACLALEDDETYLEIGTYRGSTLIGALLDNDAKAVVIDDRSEPLHSDGRIDSEEWRRFVRLFYMQSRISLHEMRYQEFFERCRAESSPKIGVAFLDGFNQDHKETYAMLELITPYLADNAVVIMDDYNMQKTHRGMIEFERDHDEFTLLLAVTTPEMQHKHPSFWNGIGVLAYRRRNVAREDVVGTVSRETFHEEVLAAALEIQEVADADRTTTD